MIIFGQNPPRFCRACGSSDRPGLLEPRADLTFVLLDVDAPTGICLPCAEDAGWDPRFFILVGREDQMVA